ncbi:MAG: RpiB/LacA/LacB family sugar-phosphate isomerase, partial [Patescibacteria group bacterium]
QHARQNDNISIISLAGDILKVREAQEIVDIILSTSFSGEERYLRRLQKIADIENQNFKS